jgi:hypothetical protein
MEHRSADWTEGTDPGSRPRADDADSTGSGANGGATSGDSTGDSTGGGEDVSAPGEGDGGARPGTGEPRVDAALRLLDRLVTIPVSEHPGLYEQVHAQLSEVLGELDTGPGS